MYGSQLGALSLTDGTKGRNNCEFSHITASNHACMLTLFEKFGLLGISNNKQDHLAFKNQGGSQMFSGTLLKLSGIQGRDE